MRNFIDIIESALKDKPVLTEESSGHKPNKAMAAAASRGLELRKKFNRGGTEVGVARARDLSNMRDLSDKTVLRMHSYFSRHEVDKQGKDFGNNENPSAGYIAWLLWGGDAGQKWAESRAQKIKDKK